jgi:hypothetical protein
MEELDRREPSTKTRAWGVIRWVIEVLDGLPMIPDNQKMAQGKILDGLARSGEGNFHSTYIAAPQLWSADALKHDVSRH